MQIRVIAHDTLRSRAQFRNRNIAGHFDVAQIERSVAALAGNDKVPHLARIESEYMRRHDVRGHRVVRHQNQPQVMRPRAGFESVSDGDGVGNDQVRVAELEQVNDLLMQLFRVPDHALLVREDTDVEFERLRDGGRDVVLEFGHPDFGVRARHAIGGEEVAVHGTARQRHARAGLLVEIQHRHAGFFAEFVITRCLEQHAAGHAHAAGFADAKVRGPGPAQRVDRRLHHTRLRVCVM